MKSLNGSTNPNKSTSVGIVALLAVVTAWVGWTALHTGPPAAAPGIVVREAPSASNPDPSVPPSAHPTPGNSASSAGTAEAELVVHVAGAVKKPGVYHMQPGARNEDAVKAAGGFTAAASPDAINLAAHAEDGSQLYIPTRSEHPSGGASPNGNASPTSNFGGVSLSKSSSSKGAKSGGQSSRSSNKLSDPSQGQINLNTADSTLLQRIPGIGPAMAERILAYRHTAGRFQSPDELLQVSGIGDKKYQKMKPFLTVR